jgi:hypothetical protein
LGSKEKSLSWEGNRSKIGPTMLVS